MRLPARAAAVGALRLPPPVSAPRPLDGSWAAVRWAYARPDGRDAVDLIADRRGTITLSIAAETFVLSVDVPPDGPRGATGRLRIAGEDWLDLVPADEVPQRVGYRRAAGTLVLRSESAAWDFSGAGEEPAEFTAVLVRL